MANSSVAVKSGEKSVQTREETRADERYVKPSVDIIETEDGLTLIADIPGAMKNTLDVNIDKGILTLNAPVAVSMPGRPIYNEFECAHYYRQFSIPENLDHEKVKADVSNGVLTIRLPVAESAKPRRIEIKAG